MKEKLKLKILAANSAYRSGVSIMSDQEFDDLVEKYSQLVSKEEYNIFRNSLHEETGKIKHPYILGSLDKIKAEEPENVFKFLKKYITNSLSISAKIDGISCRLHYENGKFVSASTRGNGEFGIDLTDKAKIIKGIPQTISTTDTLDIRGELVICLNDFSCFENEFANPRNATAGLINRKEWKHDEISKITFIAYTILGNKFTKYEQFKLLDNLNFNTAWNITLEKSLIDDNIVNTLINLATASREYETDGLVLSDISYINEDKYRPNSQVAFKINQQTAITTVIDVAFDGPSKSGIHCPVAILEPIELGGVTVSRATLHNIDFLTNLNLKYGSKVQILRSGDVIPKIIKVIENTEYCTDIILPHVCNCCGEKLIRDGVNLKCINKKCKDQIIHRLTSFIKKMGVKSVSEKTLENLGILSFNDLIKFIPDKKYKTQVKFYDELKIKVFTRSKQELLAAMNFKDISETLVNKIVDFYGLDNIILEKYIGLPEGIGEITLQKFKDDILENLEYVNMFINDSRYNYTQSNLVSSESTPKNGMSICFTGKLNTLTRTDAEKYAINNGFTISSVNKNLTYLVTNDPNTTSGKGKKARMLGIKIISENEFLKMISNQTLSQDIFEL